MERQRPRPPKSLKGGKGLIKDQISMPVSFPTQHTASIAPPKKVIKALYDYTAQAPGELTFSQGDFFHVIGRENEPDWFEASNPTTDSKGLVPVRFFQVLEKAERLITDSTSIPTHKPKVPAGEPQLNDTSKKMQPLYGVVLYDFIAERPDELEAKAGEPIIVIAQSNEEWFVAKPIGRLGGPGLIPVSFVEIRDAVTGRTITNVAGLMNNPKTPIPKVEEWKKMTQGYEANSIPLGQLSFNDSGFAADNGRGRGYDDQYAQDRFAQATQGYGKVADDYGDEYDRYDTRRSDDSYIMPPNMDPRGESPIDKVDPRGPGEEEPYVYDNGTEERRDNVPAGSRLVINAEVDSFISEGDTFWYILNVELANGEFRVLYRLYEDFYDFQINLLEDFPQEAGRTGGKRTLPYMPGPVKEVDEVVTEQRRLDLDRYVKKLCALPDYISHSQLVQEELFGIREGDLELDYDPRENVEEPSGPMPSDDQYMRENDYNQHDYPEPHQKPPSPTLAKASAVPAMPDYIKIKIIHQEDIIAIRVPTTCSFETLASKIYQRLDGAVSLRYKDDRFGTKFPLESDDDLHAAFIAGSVNGKLMVYAV